MDFNRPSVKKKSKGKGRSLDISLSDSELESELVNAWQNDRAKKKARKQKREELRSQGLLGRGRQNPSLKDKYSNGIGTEDLRSEIRHFLLSPRNRYICSLLVSESDCFWYMISDTFSLQLGFASHVEATPQTGPRVGQCLVYEIAISRQGVLEVPHRKQDLTDSCIFIQNNISNGPYIIKWAWATRAQIPRLEAEQA